MVNLWAIIALFCQPLTVSDLGWNPNVRAVTVSFNPTNNLNLIYWLDAQTNVYVDKPGVTNAANGDKVSRWIVRNGVKDCTGVDRHITCPTPGEEGKYQGGPNSLKAVNFPATTNALLQVVLTEGEDGCYSTIPQPFTVVLVSGNVGSTASIVTDTTSYWIAQSSSHIEMYAGSLLTLSNMNASWNLSTMVFNGASSLIRTNGVTGKTGDAGSSGIEFGLVFGLHPFMYAPLDGSIVEFMIYNIALTPTEITAVEAYLKIKYAL